LCFDALVCREVMEHFEYPRSVFPGLFGALNPKGKLILTDA
jgi:2-polyprenyl-3-methyl-5-hydroxy-6-metoxy-1,4-benzoquinol methylase